MQNKYPMPHAFGKLVMRASANTPTLMVLWSCPLPFRTYKSFAAGWFIPALWTTVNKISDKTSRRHTNSLVYSVNLKIRFNAFWLLLVKTDSYQSKERALMLLSTGLLGCSLSLVCSRVIWKKRSNWDWWWLLSGCASRKTDLVWNFYASPPGIHAHFEHT